MDNSDIEKKSWKVRDASGKKELQFLPIFEIKQIVDGTQYSGGQDKEIECRLIDIIIPDDKGNSVQFQMNFSDLYMFVYMCAEEELRQQLQMRWERQSVNIPYEVTFKLSADEIEQKMAKRLITLTVDEITLAIARAGANKLLKGLKPESVEEYVYKKMQQLKANK
jgi:hypothetical protein